MPKARRSTRTKCTNSTTTTTTTTTTSLSTAKLLSTRYVIKID